MDEIALLREYRKDVAAPSTPATARARAMLAAAIAVEARGSLRRREPVGGVGWRSRGLLRLALAGVVGAALVAAIVALTTSTGPGETPTAAAAALRQVAAIAAARPQANPPRPGQYVYTKSREDSLDSRYESPVQRTWSIREPYTRQAWIGLDGSGRLRAINGRARFATRTDRRLCLASGATVCTKRWLGVRPGRVSDHRYRPGGLAYQDLTRLPTQPRRLLRFIKTRRIGRPFHRLASGPRTDAEVFGEVGSLLNETYAPPRLRSALYRLVSDLPGVELVGPTRNSVGQKGVAVAQTRYGQREELIFDPRNSDLIGTQLTLVNPEDPHMKSLHLPAGARIGSTSYLRSAVVNSDRALPGGGHVRSPKR
jgi:hypothetical protein